ncbi:tRNA(Ile)-lysidine synthetase [Photobacterium aquae]|uniref:tRNA(Ile)-lysidine synthase n=1 Tax=Photobacterium aquae TaxID=1195763 RepID=A0A0J1HA10_9GAMM|nr:tRNA lysidine(34) synthetase TilS [Photobacterium aquae]KLV08540.1 tRNA(Ile)-lysidine synthetase [Photobacterium aquae]
MLLDVLNEALARFPIGQRYVLALSGGLDSRVLLDLMRRFLLQNSGSCVAVYVHHGLSSNADHWAEQCRTWSEEAGIPCVVEHVQVAVGAGVSIEQSARDARYQALAKHICAGEVLLTAQHADDQLETFILAMKRGSGPAGLSAMPAYTPFAKGTHCRPLLGIPRSVIESYGCTYGLSWVEDESNRDERYDRNFLRHRITPLLTERWPGIRKAVARSAQLCGEQEALLQELLADRLALAMRPDRGLEIAELGSERQGKALIRQWLSVLGAQMPSQAQLEQIWHSVVTAREDANPQLCWASLSVRRFQNALYLVEQWPSLAGCVLEWPGGERCDLPSGLGELAWTSIGEIANPQARWSARIRRPRSDEKVTIRFEPAGLDMWPAGRAGRRKLKKLFQEAGVPSWNRRRMPLVFYGDQLVAVAGLGVNRDYVDGECELVWYLPSKKCNQWQKKSQ